MVHRKKARSDEETLRARLDQLPDEGRDWFHAPLTGVIHSKSLRPPTKRVHARVQNLWTLFVTRSGDPEVKTVGTEMRIPPSEGKLVMPTRFPSSYDALQPLSRRSFVSL